MLSKLKSKIEHAHFAEQVNRWSYRLGLPGAECNTQQEKRVLGIETVNNLIIDAIREQKPVLCSKKCHSKRMIKYSHIYLYNE